MNLGQNFKSYIVPTKSALEKNGAVQEVKPKLLNNELVVGEAHSVVMLAPLSDRDHGRYGSLFITNYRLAFVPLETIPADECGQRNYLLGKYDVPLTGVNTLYITDGKLERRRRLQPTGEIPSKVKGLQVVCKNMKVLTFNFENCAVGKGRSVTMALLHRAYPERHDLLFAFEYREPYYPTLPTQLKMYLKPLDWKSEVERCGVAHWRLSCVNGTSDAFMASAGETLVVPASVLDCSLVETARHFRSGSIPVWVWGRSEGAALLRSGELLSPEHSATESVYLEQVRRSHPKLTPPHVIYLCGNSLTNAGVSSRNSMVLDMRRINPDTLPPLATLNSAHKKLADMCTPTTLSTFWKQDSDYYSILDSSKWLRYVANCLSFANEAATKLANNVTVVLQEGDGVDYAAVVSSLTQIIVDPHYRTIIGFQSLIQKEWVAIGHPFCDRFGLPRPGANMEALQQPGSPAPVFLLFLDCVWQLTRQAPSYYQFTETYLTTLWDCANNHLFHTFLFNCPRELQLAKNFVPRPVWDWGEQFSEQDIALFHNPLYNGQQAEPTRRKSTSSPARMDSMSTLNRVPVSSSVADVAIWSQCYERWLPPLATVAAAHNHVMYNYKLCTEINRLRDKLSSLSILSERNGSEAKEAPLPADVPRFYPFVSTGVTPDTALDCMQASLIDASRLLDSQSLLNAPD